MAPRRAPPWPGSWEGSVLRSHPPRAPRGQRLTGAHHWTRGAEPPRDAVTPPSQKVPWTPPPNARPGRPRAHGRESSPLPASPPRPRERRPTASGQRGPGTLPTLLPSRRGTGSSHSRAARPRALPAVRKPHTPSRPRLGRGSGRDRKTPARSPAEALLASPVVPGTKPTSRPLPAPRRAGAGSQGRRAHALACLATTPTGCSHQWRRGGMVADADPGKRQHKR